MKRRIWVFAILVPFLAGCGKVTEQDIMERYGEIEQQPVDDVTVTPTVEATKAPEARNTPVPASADRSTPPPTVTPTSTSTPTPAPTNTPTPAPTSVPEDYGDEIFVFDREYTDEWAWIEVCFWLKDKDGNPLADEWCELLVDEDYVMIKSPLVVDYYDTRQDAVTDEEGKVEFIIMEQWGDGDRELNLTITTRNSRHTEKIYCVDPVRTVPSKPEVTVQQTEYIRLGWEKDYDARWYYIERKVNDGEYELIKKTDLYDWYGDYDVKSGNTYYYRVYGGNHAGYGEACEIYVPYVTPMEDLGELKVNVAEVFVNEETMLYFSIRPEAGLFPGQELTLLWYEGEELVNSIPICDDGSYQDGIVADGYFERAVLLEEAEEKTYTVRAKLDYSVNGESRTLYSANDVEINVFSRLTEEQAEEFFELLEDERN
ncbi:MAG: hypothetical protein IJW37_02395 [Lachnospiraceae bacterium]|nr:hypothetical protein [Lachnospiraceae bacterium]